MTVAQVMAVITRPVFIEKVVLQIDGPQLVLARDAVDTAYLCALVSRDDEGDRFVAVKVSDKRYSDVRRGDIELRKAFSRPETPEFFTGLFAQIEERPAITLQARKPFPERWLPKMNVFVTDFIQAPDSSDVLAQANASRRTTICCLARRSVSAWKRGWRNEPQR